MARGQSSNQANADGLLFGTKVRSSLEPKLTEREARELKLKQAIKVWATNNKVRTSDFAKAKAQGVYEEEWVAQGIFDRLFMKDKKPHREGAPAVLRVNQPMFAGETETHMVMWFQDGVLHRDKGPAVETFDLEIGEVVSKEWHKNGKVVKTWEHPSFK